MNTPPPMAVASAAILSDGVSANATTESPGFHTMPLGDFKITALSDGTIDLPMDKVLVGPHSGDIETLLHHAHLNSPIKTSVNQFLIDTGSRLILVDAGAGTFLGPTLGRLVTNLRAAGYHPEQIDDVLLTHLHVDHVGGLSHHGKMMFPNATLRVNKNDLSYWSDDANVKREREANR